MKRSFFAFAIGVVLLMWSCSHNGNKNDLTNAGNRITQQEDGTVSLNIGNAACYSDMTNPSGNTAEWVVVISKPGRFEVWLSSATKDTTDLNYTNSVRISLLDKQLEADPACDRIIHTHGDLPLSYFRADSYMGSFFVSEPGEYIIQVISEKVIARNSVNPNTIPVDNTMLMSVILTPPVR